jgi:hypothetical protein
MRNHPAGAVLVAVLGLVMLGSACSRSEPTSPRPSPALSPVAAPAPPPAAAAPFKVVAVDVGKAIGADKRVTSPTTSFAAGDTIYASVSSVGTAASVVVKARWTYQDGQLVDESSQTIAPSGPSVTEFHVSKPGGWPAGKYKVEISANGSAAGAREFDVTG